MAPVPASAPGRVARFLRDAPDGPVRVLHHVPTALYLDVAGRCVGVVTPQAAQVPCALRLSERVSQGSVLVEHIANPYLERGTLYLTDDPLVVGRFVDVRVPRIDPDRVLRRAASPAAVRMVPPRTAAQDGLAAYKGHQVPLPSPGTAAQDGLAAYKGHQGHQVPLPSPGTAAQDGLAAYKGHQGHQVPLPSPATTAQDALAAYKSLPPLIDSTTIGRLVGHGGGLTPLGDDVLCGWLAVLHATGRLTDDVAARVRAAAPRTTLLSATLLDCALHGEVLPEFAAYVAALGTPAEPDAARTLLAIGHTSGAGLWFGAEHALTTIALEAAA